MADIIASARNMTVVAENQYNTVGLPKASITPATLTAMVGFKKGGGQAIDLAPNVQAAMTKLQTVASSTDYPANVNAQTALTNLTNVQGKLFNKNDCGGFGDIVASAQAHCDDSKDIIAATTFLKNSNYPDFGSGITNMSSMTDRGMSNSFGDLSGAGAALAGTGTIFNGVDMKNIGTPGGIVEGLNNNKLGNATGINSLLAEQGINTNNLHDLANQDKISSILGSVNDPEKLKASADQFEQANPFAGLPSYTGQDASLYQTPSFGTPSNPSYPPSSSSSTAFGAPTTTATATTGFSTGGTSFGAGAAPEVTTGGLQSLADLGDPSKTGGIPSEFSGLTGGLSGIGTKFSDMGAGKLTDASQAPAFFGSIQTVNTPLTDAAHPTLNSLVEDNLPDIESMIGSSIPPNVRDILGPVGGSPEIDALASGEVTAEKVAALEASVSKSNGFIAAASLQASAGTPTQSLGKSMGFATSLHKYGKDMSEGGVGTMLKNMANTSTKYGEGVAAALAEGKNNDLLGQNGIGPLQTNPFEGVPSYTGTDGSLQTNPQIKMMGGS